MFGIWLWGLGAVMVCVGLLWLWSLRLQDVSIIDSFWGVGFVISVWIYVALSPEARAPAQWVHLALVTLWGLRLAAHIAIRHHKAGQEDYRYRAMRERTPDFATKSLLRVFVFQGALTALIALPLLFAQAGERPEGLLWTDVLFLALFAIGFTFEAVADWQLTRFKADPGNRGRVLNTGLWRYSRHPNYFGDAVVWWSFWIFALGSENGGLTLPSVLLMTLFLLKVSGVSLLEKTITDRRPAYGQYIAETPAFFPWFPAKKATVRDSVTGDSW